MHIEEHKSLKKHNTFAIDCSARYFASIQSISDLKKALKSKIHSKIFILGGGSNLLLTQDIDALVIHINIKGIEIITFNNEKIQFIEANPFVTVQFKKTLIKSQLIGKYNYQNIAAAIAIGNYFNVEVNEMKDAIENYIPSNNRSQIIQKGTNKIILDAYNANPSSMQAALENFKQLEDSSKIVFLGDMFELGNESTLEHQKIAELATSFHFKEVYLIGKTFSTTNVKNAFIYFSLILL